MQYRSLIAIFAVALAACTADNPEYIGDGQDLAGSGGGGNDLASGGDDLGTGGGDDLASGGGNDLAGRDLSTRPVDLAGADLRPPPGCTTVTDAKYHVDPKTGVDAATTTGAAACPFRTVKAAMAYVTAGALTPAQVVLDNDVGPATETFPIRVLTGITVTSGATTRSVLPGAGEVGFTLAAANCALSDLVLNGASSAAAGIGVATGSDATSTKLSGITVIGFRNHGISVESGGVFIGEGVSVLKNGLSPSAAAPPPAGLEARGGNVVIDVGAGANATQFDGNASGIIVEGTAGLQLTGVPASDAVTSGSGTVTASGNMFSNIVVHQSAAAGAIPGPVDITGVVANGSQGGAGVHVFANSRLTLRDSVTVGNKTNGVQLSPVTGNVQITQGIDLGSGGSFGKNTLQAATGGNTNAGLCVESFPSSTSVTVEARGNIFANVDCSALVVVGGTTSATTCTGGVDIGGTANNVTIRLANCPDQ